jgi:hypothetical protein
LAGSCLCSISSHRTDAQDSGWPRVVASSIATQWARPKNPFKVTWDRQLTAFLSVYTNPSQMLPCTSGLGSKPCLAPSVQEMSLPPVPEPFPAVPSQLQGSCSALAQEASLLHFLGACWALALPAPKLTKGRLPAVSCFTVILFFCSTGVWTQGLILVPYLPFLL